MILRIKEIPRNCEEFLFNRYCKTSINQFLGDKMYYKE